jgi:hypothetical protein
MSIEKFVVVQISRQTRGVTQAGFGIPLILGPNGDFTGVRTYRSLAAVSADFLESDDEYKAAAGIFSQTPRPEEIKIKKSPTNVAQVSDVVIATVANNSLYRVIINGVSFDYTSDADATAAEIRDGLIAAVNAGTEPVTASASGADVRLTADNAGESFSLSVGDNKLTITPVTANVGIASAILEALQEDKEWYALITTDITDVTVKEAAKTIEALRRIYGVRRSDAAIRTAATNDIMTFLKNKGYDRTFLLHSGTVTDFGEARWMGRVLPLDPGSETWAFKTLQGLTVDGWTDSEQEFLDTKNANYYIETAGVRHTVNGKMASGEFIDIMRGIDWLQARIEEGIFQQLVISDKIPFTDQGIAIVENILRQRLQNGVTVGLLESFTISVPKAADVAFESKAARTLPDVEFEAVLQGAIHKIIIQGVVTL